MIVSRRALLSSLPILTIVAVLPGCAGFSISQTSADISMIAKGVKAILPLIQAVTGIGSKVYDEIAAIVAEIEALAVSNTTAVGTSVWSNVGASLQKIVGLITGLTVPSWVSTVLAAAVALVTSYLPSMKVMPSMVARASIGMTPDQARSVLLAAAK
jgi:hypothetical protein